MPRPARHKHQMVKINVEMRQMRGWIVRISYWKCTWPRCTHRKRDVKRLEKL